MPAEVKSKSTSENSNLGKDKLSLFILIFLGFLLLAALFCSFRNIQRIQTLNKEEFILRKQKKELKYLKTHSKFREHLPKTIPREEISKAMDEIVTIGRDSNIQFSFIDLRKSRKNRKAKKDTFAHQEIEMSVQANYNTLGVFLESLGQLERSTISIERMKMVRNLDIKPLVEANLTIYMYLNE